MGALASSGEEGERVATGLLHHEVPAVRQNALRAFAALVVSGMLSPCENEMLWSVAVALLADVCAEVRATAAAVLAEADAEGKSHADDVVCLLQDPAPIVRAAAARALSAMSDATPAHADALA